MLPSGKLHVVGCFSDVWQRQSCRMRLVGIQNVPVRLSLSARSRFEPCRSTASARTEPRHAATITGVRPASSGSPVYFSTSSATMMYQHASKANGFEKVKWSRADVCRRLRRIPMPCLRVKGRWPCSAALQSRGSSDAAA